MLNGIEDIANQIYLFNFILMPPKNPELIHRNPSRLYANGWVGIEECRGCLFKALCLENEKNPVVRRLVLGEEMPDDDDQQDDFAVMMRGCAL